MHLKPNKVDPFLKRIITCDEKWIVYNNVSRKRSWSNNDEAPQITSKADILQKKIMLSVRWDWKGVVCFNCFQTKFECLLSTIGQIEYSHQREATRQR